MCFKFLKKGESEMKYNLKFISREVLKNHINDYVDQYIQTTKQITLLQFNSNKIDAIKLIFDSKVVYDGNYKSTINAEVSRQLDKSRSNIIGYFHQNIFKYIYPEKGWYVPISGFDVANDKLHIYAEIKNKHNTMNDASTAETLNRLKNKPDTDSMATCYLVEVISKRSKNEVWNIRGNTNHRIRKISMDCFYEIVTGESDAFYQLYRVLPGIIDEIMLEKLSGENTSNSEIITKLLKTDDVEEALGTLSFETYKGFKKK